MDPLAEARSLPHYVYLHYEAGRVVYVGMTRRPEVRPYKGGAGRPWVPSCSVEVSSPMTYAQAAWVESHLIRAYRPKHNKFAPAIQIEGYTA